MNKRKKDSCHKWGGETDDARLPSVTKISGTNILHQSEDTNYNFGVSHEVRVFGMIYRIAELQ
jgi:hypothetical protein